MLPSLSLWSLSFHLPLNMYAKRVSGNYKDRHTSSSALRVFGNSFFCLWKLTDSMAMCEMSALAVFVTSKGPLFEGKTVDRDSGNEQWQVQIWLPATDQSHWSKFFKSLACIGSGWYEIAHQMNVVPLETNIQSMKGYQLPVDR